MSPGAGRFGTYAFYSFLVQSPLALRAVWLLQFPGSSTDEYARYLASMRIFGSFEENGGSILRALVHHPAWAAVWLALKPLDLVVRVLHLDSLTPLVLVPCALAFRRVRREGVRLWVRDFEPLLAAFVAPFLLLAATADQVHHLLTVAPLLIIGVLWGLMPWMESLTGRVALWTGAVVAAAGLVGVGVFGHWAPRLSTPSIEAASRWFEARCRSNGCLVNALPLAVEAQAWADLQAGARLPPRIRRSEAWVRQAHPPWFADGVRWTRRLAAARRNGWDGPTLYFRSDGAYSDLFEPEHRLEGPADLSRARRAAAFQDGRSAVEVFELDPGDVPGG